MSRTQAQGDRRRSRRPAIEREQAQEQKPNVLAHEAPWNRQKHEHAKNEGSTARKQTPRQAAPTRAYGQIMPAGMSTNDDAKPTITGCEAACRTNPATATTDATKLQDGSAAGVAPRERLATGTGAKPLGNAPTLVLGNRRARGIASAPREQADL